MACRVRTGRRTFAPGERSAAPRRWPRAAPANAVATLVALLAAGEAHAGGVPPARVGGRPALVVVLVRGERDRELAGRLAGQVADLDLVLSRTEVSLPPDLEGQLAVARAAGVGAEAVVWFGADGGDSLAYVALRGQLQARRIEPATGALSRSASAEAIAIAARTLLEGVARGHAREDQVRPTAPPALRAWAEFGWTGLLDGVHPSGHHGVALRAGAARGRWLLSATLGLLPPAAVDAPPGTLDVGREHAALLVGAELLPAGAGRRWSVALDLGVGVARLRRSTAATAAGFTATPARVSWSALVAPGVRVARRVVSDAWLALELGADLLGSPPRFAVQRTDGLDAVRSTWAAQPRAGLSLLVDWR